MCLPSKVRFGTTVEQLALHPYFIDEKTNFLTTTGPRYGTHYLRRIIKARIN